MSVMARKIVRDRAREVREVAPDEAADDDWPWLLERIAEDNLSLLARVKELEGITGTSFRECVRNLMRSRGVKRQKELVGRMRGRFPDNGECLERVLVKEAYCAEALLPVLGGGAGADASGEVTGGLGVCLED